MSEITNPVEALFLRALEVPLAEREAFLTQQCGDDADLLAQAQELLAAHEQTGSFVVDRHAGFAETSTSTRIELGEAIGPYKLLQEIGEGGMGIVYMADQKEPIKRRVALKIIKPGMDSKQVLARFEAERQALAMMNHPNIAKIHDAGTTEGGLPFFAMELVKGVPITKFCDDNRFSTKQRLELFIDVCKAVQHAHQKGVIHRDLKPSNVLVAKFDDQPVVKVIDFGVAKATNQELTERTMFTQFGQIVGTLEYMSPEQAQFNQLDIDTRSDIYSLGVLLYELLTGAPPFDRDRLRTAAFDEIIRIIREEEPPRPSARLSTLGKDAELVSQSRGTDVSTLGRLVRGDVDLIVMKAMEKDRGRRYESASGLAADLKRYLDGQPIEARPASVLYRLSRYYSRNRFFVTAVSMMLIVFTSLGAFALNRLFRERDIARRLQQEFFEKALTELMSGNTNDQNTVDSAQSNLTNQTHVSILRGVQNLNNGNPIATIDELEPIVEAGSKDVKANALLAMAYYQSGRLWDGIRQRDLTNKIAHRDEVDELFLAFSSMGVDPRGMQFSTDYLKANRTPLGFLVDAEVRTWNCVYADEPVRAVAKAREQFLAAKPYFDSSAYALHVELMVYQTSIEIAERFGQPADEFYSKARKAESQLAKEFPEHIWARFWRGSFFWLNDDFESAAQVWNVEKNDLLLANCALALIRLNKIEEAMMVAEKIDDPLFRVFVAPGLMQTESGRKILRNAFFAAVERARDRLEYREPFLLAAGALAGVKESERRNIAEQWLATWEDGKGDWLDWNLEVLRYFLEGDRNLLVKSEKNGVYQEYSQFYLALFDITDGNRIDEGLARFRQFDDLHDSMYLGRMWADCLSEQLGNPQVRSELETRLSQVN
ncbi:MAG: serine/threonine protein kinase [Planctomycetales bacterium]|nr:serine/threonine protein kinase [Planctomycetales bacterium]